MSGRVYERKFDHDDARARYSAGETITELAAAFGVTWNAVQRVVVPGVKERFDRHAREWAASGRCDDCGGPMNNHSRSSSRSTRCVKCSAAARTTSVRHDAILCFGCREWKPDNEFPRNRHAKQSVRRGHHSLCRACQTVAKRSYIERNRKPCATAGCSNRCRPESTYCKGCAIRIAQDAQRQARSEGRATPQNGGGSSSAPAT